MYNCVASTNWFSADLSVRDTLNFRITVEILLVGCGSELYIRRQSWILKFIKLNRLCCKTSWL